MVEGHGRAKTFADGWTEYIGFDGTVRALGTRISIIMAGEAIDLHCIGSGRAILWGRGTYEIDGRVTNTWSEPLQIVSY